MSGPRPKASVRTMATLVCMCALVALVGAQQPTFRSSVDVTTVDVIVIDSRGRPITDLTADDFRVQVDGRERRVISARWIPQTAAGRQVSVPEIVPGYTTNEGSIDGRLFIMAVDQPNLRFASLASMRPGLNNFIDRLESSDRLAAIALGHGLSTPLTTDRARVKTALSQMTGDFESPTDRASINISMSEALDITAAGRVLSATFVRVALRECNPDPPVVPTPPWDLFTPNGQCFDGVYSDAVRVSGAINDATSRTIQALRGLLDSLKTIAGPKTLLLVTEGFLLADQGPESVIELGEAAAAAQTTIYALKLDDYTPDASTSRRSTTPLDDKRIRRDGVELLAAVARGQVFDVMGAGDSALKQVEQEISGYYLIGVESQPTDLDRKRHPIAVSVSRRGADVRARATLSNVATPPRTPTEHVTSALRSPFANPGLPLRVSTFPFRQGDGPNIQLLMHVEAGNGYSSLTQVSLGYVIANSQGEVVTNTVGTATLPPAIPGTPSPLFYTNGVTLPPGEYSLKFAVTEGDRVGSVEHLVHALLDEAGTGRVSDLVVGGPAGEEEPERPAVGYDVSFGRVQGYLEAYGLDVNDWTTTYEVASIVDGPPLFSVGVPGRVTGDGRMVFSKTLPINDLAPGKYFLRAAVSTNDRTLKTLSRQFRVTPVTPSVTATAAAAFALAPRAVVLPVADAMIIRSFAREQVLGETLQRFRRTVSPAARAKFDAGGAALVQGDYEGAQANFRSAVQPAFTGANNMAPLAYLGAVAAASGNDEEAVSIWQTSLAVGSGLPEVYEWMGQAWLRMGLIPQARSAFAEGALKWPAEPRFTRVLACVYARLGQSREALQTIAGYLSQRPADTDMLALGVEWVFRAHATGGVVSEGELTFARRWTEAYERANGPRQAEVRRWLQMIETGALGTPPSNPI